MKDVSLLDNIKNFLFSMEPSLDNVKSILNIFDISIDELLSILAQDNRLIFWSALVYAGLMFGVLLNWCGEVTSSIYLPDCLLNVDTNILKDNVMPFNNYIKSLYNDNIIFNGDILAYPVELLNRQTGQTNYFDSYFSITHGFQVQFSLYGQVNEPIRIFILQEQDNQAAISAYNELMENQTHISNIANFNIFVGEMPSAMYTSLPFIPTNLPLSDVWNLRIHTTTNSYIEILDVPHNVDQLSNHIGKLYELIIGIEDEYIAQDQEQDRVMRSLHRRQLQVLRYLEAIYIMFDPEYSVLWESRFDYDSDSEDRSMFLIEEE